MKTKMKRLHLPTWAWLAIVILLAAFGFLIIWLPSYTTSNPAYCLTCHGSGGGLPNRGIESKVHPSFAEVTCVACHAKPHQIVYEGYRKGYMSEPERVGPNCLKCHPQIALRNDEAGFKFNDLKIKIPHKLHLDLGAKCNDCHSNIAHDLKEPQTNRPRMEYCSQCHATTVEACSKCHIAGIPPGPIPTAPPAGLTGDGKGLYSKYCAECHGSKGDRIPDANLQSKEYLLDRGLVGLRLIATEGHGGMPPFGKGRGGPLTDDEIRAISAYLKLSAEGLAVNGQTLYENNCLICHGAEGDKMPTVPLNSEAFLSGLGRDMLILAISEGKGGMPAFGKAEGGPLSYEEIVAVERYILALAGGPQRTASALYAEHCATCHGKDGSQIPTANLGSKEYLSSQGDEALLQATAQGKGSMPAFSQEYGGNLSAEEIQALLEYLKAKAGLIILAPPPIPHSLEGMRECLRCHGIEGIKPVPVDHAGRSEDTCQVCHGAK